MNKKFEERFLFFLAKANSASCSTFSGASIISKRRELLPEVSADGWFHIPARGDHSKAKWPQPTPGAYNYYHASSQDFIDSILEDRDPVPNLDWGLISYQSGQRYDMTTRLDY